MADKPRPLREWRLRKMLTAAQLAEAAGISLRAYGAIERGESAPRVSTMNKLCAILWESPMEIEEFRAVIQAPEKEGE